jgi:hypothetical protein
MQPIILKAATIVVLRHKGLGAIIYPSFAHKIYLERENIIIKYI